MEPINENILIEVDKKMDKTEKGWLMPQVEGDKTEAFAIRGTVLEISDDIEKQKVKKGQRVLLAKWEGQHYQGNGKHYILIKQKDILAIIT